MASGTEGMLSGQERQRSSLSTDLDEEQKLRQVQLDNPKLFKKIQGWAETNPPLARRLERLRSLG